MKKHELPESLGLTLSEVAELWNDLDHHMQSHQADGRANHVPGVFKPVFTFLLHCETYVQTGRANHQVEQNVQKKTFPVSRAEY